MNPGDPLHRIWDSYARKCIPLTAPEVQWEQTKLAFYAGAFAAMNAMVKATDTMPEEEAANYMASLMTECTNLCDQYAKERNQE